MFTTKIKRTQIFAERETLVTSNSQKDKEKEVIQDHGQQKRLTLQCCHGCLA